MPDGSTFRDALAGVEAFSVRGRIAFAPAEPAVRIVLRGAGEAIAAASGAFGFALPETINTAATDGERIAMMLGPDEWLLVAPASFDVAAFRMAVAAGSAEACSIVEVTNRNTAIRLSGAAVEDVLNTMNPLDLSLAAFPVGMATRTLYGKADVVLWREGPQAFRLECWRSFAPYVYGQLIEAAKEYVKG